MVTAKRSRPAVVKSVEGTAASSALLPTIAAGIAPSAPSVEGVPLRTPDAAQSQTRWKIRRGPGVRAAGASGGGESDRSVGYADTPQRQRRGGDSQAERG